MQPKESRIELKCKAMPFEPTPEEIDRERDTEEQWQRAKKIANQFDIAFSFTDISLIEDETFHGDAYLYPSLNILIKLLDALDAANVEFDYIDLPEDASQELRDALNRKWYGIFVNGPDFPYEKDNS